MTQPATAGATSTALQTVDPATRQLAHQLDYAEDFVQTVKEVYAKGATDTELKLFLQTAKRTGLDPFARQIYCIKRYDSSQQKTVMSTQVSIDGFRLIADRTGAYVPSKEPTYTFDADGQLESATAYIKKLVGGTWHEVSATAFFSEYVQKTKDGTPNSMWKKMPRLMLAKCAESLVLRKAFPAELSGLYTPEEMGNGDEVVEATNEAHPHLKLATPATAATAAAPVTKEEPLNKQLAELCRQMNDAFDTKLWTANHLTQHARDFFNDQTIIRFSELNDDKKRELIADLQSTLKEREAINGENDVVEGEIVTTGDEAEAEAATPVDPDDQVF